MIPNEFVRQSVYLKKRRRLAEVILSSSVVYGLFYERRPCAVERVCAAVVSATARILRIVFVLTSTPRETNAPESSVVRQGEKRHRRCVFLK